MNYYVIESENTDFIFYLMSRHHFILLSDMFIRYKLHSSVWIFFFMSIKILKGI